MASGGETVSVYTIDASTGALTSIAGSPFSPGGHPVSIAFTVGTGVYIAGTPIVGQQLTGHYSYSDVDGDAEGTSTFRWLRDSAPISGATANTYTVVLADLNHSIVFEVTPVAATGTSPGAAASSGSVTISNTPPSVTPVGVTRPQGTSGSALIATVSDIEDAPGSLAITVQSDNPSNGVTLSGLSNNGGNVTANVAVAANASTATFALRATDSLGASGTGILTVTVTANSAPTATGVNITGTPGVGQVLTGHYTYGDADGDLEGTSTFRWLRDGVAIGGATSGTYTLVADDYLHTIVFEVTPVALAGTLTGAPVQSIGVNFGADVVWTNGNDILFFDGVLDELDTTLINPYSGETLPAHNLYNINRTTYNGLAGIDTLLMTNVSDALSAAVPDGRQSIANVERIIAGDGADIIALASSTFVLGDLYVDGGRGDDILWGNSGNDTILGNEGDDRIDGGPGNDNLVGGPGNDIITGGAGDDTVDGGTDDDRLDGNAGNDMVFGRDGNDTLVYTLTENIGDADVYDGGTGTDALELHLTVAQANAAATEIAAAQAFISANNNTSSETGPTFTFSFGLTFSNIEALTIVLTDGPVSLTANPGTTPQSASLHAAFANALAVTALDASSNPEPNINVTFTAPSSGASGSFSNNTNTITVATDGSGVATAVFTANSTAGGPYTVTAAVGALSAWFSLTNNSAPTATGVNITGTPHAGQQLTGHYTYGDVDGDLEGTSTFRWLQDGGAIASATSLTYTIAPADLGHTLTFEVTPVAATGTSPGTPATSAGVLITVPPVPDLTIVKTHSGDFSQGLSGVPYTITVSNSGTGPTTAAVSVTDTLPSGLTATAIGGTGWSCDPLPALSCTRSDPLGASASYPAITLTVNVAANAPSSVTNTATVSGGGETNTANDTANDVTNVSPSTVTLSNSVFYGGAGDQNGGSLVITGGQLYVGGGEGEFVRYAVPPSAPTASSALAGGFLQSLTANASTVYAVGGATPPVCGASDGVGDTEPKSIIALYGTADASLSNCLSTNVFPYRGGESYGGVVTDGTYLYAMGTAETCGFGNNSYILGKHDLAGALLARVAEPSLDASGHPCSGDSHGGAIALLNGNIYIAGGSNLTGEDGVFRPVLMRYAPALTRDWKQRPTDNTGGYFTGVVGVGSSIYAVGYAGVPPNSDYLIEKYDESGNRLWSKVSGGAGADVLNAVISVGGRMFAVGSTSSEGLGGTDAVVLEFDPITGNTLSTTTYGGALDDAANAVTTDGADLYIVGSSKSFASADGNAVGQSDIMLLRYAIISPDLTITKSHSGTFTQGQTGVTYTITVTNSGTAATSGPVSVADTLPGGLTATAIVGTGWSCDPLPALSCTRSDALGAGASYLPITLTVNVAFNASSSVTNTATVSGGGEINSSNDSASDVTPITPNSAPTATGVNITGTPNVGQLLTGHYTYADVDGDLEGTSTFRWLRDGGAIGGATSNTHTVIAADAGHSITFEVTPAAATGASPGSPVQSAGVTITIPNSAPTAVVSSGTFTFTGSMSTERYYPVTALLSNGKVLVAGGKDVNGDALATAELYDPATGLFSSTGSMSASRAEHAGALLPNGKVLIVGGAGTLASAELYDPATGLFSSTGSLNTGRWFPTATLLPNGKVLVAGGFDVTGNVTATAELYDPATGLFSTTGSLNTARYFPDYYAPTLLANGKVLVAGGANGGNIPMASAELYDPATGLFSITGSMTTARAQLAFTLLPNGKVLATGGYDSSSTFLASAELYDPATGLFTATGGMSTGRDEHTATLLANGTVLVAGGAQAMTALASAELYDPAVGLFSSVGNMKSARAGHSATLLPNGAVLIAGAGRLPDPASAELFVPGITGTPGVGQSLTGHYTYSDPDGDPEGTSTFRWLSDGVAIGGANGITYTLVAADSGHTIQFEVTPVAATGSSPGSPVRSSGLVILNSAPTATGVNITGTPNVGQLLTGHYTYSDVDGDAQGTSTFRWLRDGTAISGATGGTYTPSAVDAGHAVAFEVTPVAETGTLQGAAVQSAGVTINSGPVVTASPVSQTIAAGSTATFTAAASGNPTPTVQWQQSTDGGASFVNIAGAMSTTLSFTASAGQNGNQYRAVFTNSIGSATTAAATLTVDFAPSITQNPSNTSVAAGAPASFSASASGNPIPTVQWQVSSDGLIFTDIPSATSTTLSFTAQVADNGKQYRARFSNALASNVATSSATLTLASSMLTGFALNSPILRNDFSGFAGMQLTVGARPLNVYSLGRVCVAGNAQTHTVKLVDASTKLDIAGGSAQVNMAGCTPGTFTYADLASPIMLSPGASYYLASQEFLNGDMWYEHGAISTTTDVSVSNSEYLLGGTWTSIGGPNTSYVPPDMRYAVVPLNPAPAFVLNYQHSSSLRNDFSGSVGMNLTTAANPVNVTAVGRVCVAGNSQIHTVKFVGALTGLDVPGGSAQVNMAGCTEGLFVYTALAGGPLVLAANTAYYLVSLETSGLDKWYDYGTTVQTSNVASVTAAVYSNGASYLRSGGAGNTYGPVNFQYGGTGGGAPSITQQPLSTTVAAGQTASFSVTATDGGSLSYQWQSKTSGGASFSDIGGATGTSYTTPPTSASDDGTQFQVVVTNASGSVTSNPATLTVETIPSINPQPQSVTVTAGQTASFSVSATGGGLSYQWQSRVSGAGSFSNIPGATNSSYTTPATSLADNGTQFRVAVNNLAGPTISNAATLTVQAPIGGGTSFVTSRTLGTLRNNYNGLVGMAIQVGGSPVTVNSLGRIMVAGNGAPHTVKIVDSTGTDVPGGSVSVLMAGGTPGGFVYASLGSPVTLNAGATYYIVSQETVNGDSWYDFDTTVLTTNVANVTSAVYSNGAYIAVGSAGHSYAPVDFQYATGGGGPSITQQPQSTTVTVGQTANFSVTATGAGLTYQWQSKASGAGSFSDIPSANSSSYTTPVTVITDNGTQFRCVVSGSVTSNTATLSVLSGGPPAAFVTSTSLGGSLRTDFSGLVGMAITVGNSPLTVTSVGRMVLSGNSSAHAVKFVDSSGVDIPGGSATVNTAGGTPGTFVYATLSAPITLSANTTYFVVSAETSGGDKWYDYYHTIVQTTNAASVIGPIWSSGSSYNFVSGYPESSYVPVDFQYQ